MQSSYPLKTVVLDYIKESHLNAAIVSCGNNPIRLQYPIRMQPLCPVKTKTIVDILYGKDPNVIQFGHI
jgi:hypothetical protein